LVSHAAAGIAKAHFNSSRRVRYFISASRSDTIHLAEFLTHIRLPEKIPRLTPWGYNPVREGGDLPVFSTHLRDLI
jgi:hypothetical protein